jgi:hypothetical protein
MKKIIAVLCVAGSLAACNDPKTPDTTLDKKDTVKTETPAPDSTPKMTPAPTAAVAGTATFADPEVQKLADEYAGFVREARSAAGDPVRTAEYSRKAQEWAMRMAPVMQKIKSKPEEMKKWSAYMNRLAAEMMPQNK